MDQAEIRLGDVTVHATFLNDLAPQTVAAFKTALPLQGTARHAKWCGPCFYLALTGTALNKVAKVENRIHLMPPGSIVWSPELGELFVVYDDARLYNGAVGGLYGTLLGEIEGDVSELAKEAFRMRESGVKPLSFKLANR